MAGALHADPHARSGASARVNARICCDDTYPHRSQRPSGSGKTTLAHAIASAVGCPAICRDEIKEGMVHATSGFIAGPGDPLTRRTFTTFFDVIGLLFKAGVTVVAEAAFQDHNWRLGLQPLTAHATIRIVHCAVDSGVARDRIARRVQEDARRAAHNDQELLRALAGGPASLDTFIPTSLPAPTSPPATRLISTRSWRSSTERTIDDDLLVHRLGGALSRSCRSRCRLRHDLEKAGGHG